MQGGGAGWWDLGWRRDVKGGILGTMALIVMANNYREKQTGCLRVCSDGGELGGGGGGATGFGDTLWRRCVLSQVCRGEMKGLLLGSAQLGFNLLSAPFPSR